MAKRSASPSKTQMGNPPKRVAVRTAGKVLGPKASVGAATRPAVTTKNYAKAS